MKSNREVKEWLDREWNEAMVRTGFLFRVENRKDEAPPFNSEQAIARAKILFIERMEKELEITKYALKGAKFGLCNRIKDCCGKKKL